MTRSINIGRGAIGQPRLPRQLPDSGAGLVNLATAQALTQAGREIKVAREKRAAIERAEQEKINTARSKGQLKLAGQTLNDIGLSIQDQLEQEPESTFRSEQGVQDFQARVEQGIDVQIGQFREQNPLNEDAALVFDNELPAFRAGLSTAFERGAVQRSRNILRADSMRDAKLRAGTVETFEDAEDLASGLFEHVFTPELFTESEARANVDLFRQQGYHEALRKAYDEDPVEGATLALELPEDDPNPTFKAFVRQEQRAAHRVLEGEYDPIKGAYGFETLLDDISFTKADGVEMNEEPGLIVEIFESKSSALTAKRMAFHADRQTIEQVLGKGATAAIADNFFLLQKQLDENEVVINRAFDILGGRLQSGGPYDPLTVKAAELAATLGRRLETMDLIEDDRLFARKFASDVNDYATWPASYANKLVQMFTNGQNPAGQARAARAFGAVYARGDTFLLGPGEGIVPEQMVLQMLMIDNQIKRLKVPPAQAVKNVFDRTRDVDLFARGQEFDKSHLPGQVQVMQQFSDTWIPFEDTAGLDIPGDMRGDFNELTRLYYGMTNGDIVVARKYAWSQLQTTWGVTRDAGTAAPRWAHRAPELEYQGHGDASWMGPEFQEDALKAVGRRIENARLIAVDNPSDPSGKPAYSVLEIRDGFPLFVERLDSTEGNPKYFYYRPDFKRSPAARLIRAEAVTRAFEEALPGLQVLRRRLQRQLGADPDSQLFKKASTTLAIIDEVEAELGKEDVTLEGFVNFLETFKSRIPLTDQELERRGVSLKQWTKGAALLRIKNSNIELQEIPQNPERERP